MRRARSAVDNAHLAIFVVDATNTDGATALLGKLREEAKEAEAEAAATAAQRDDAAETEGGKAVGGRGTGDQGGGVIVWFLGGWVVHAFRSSAVEQ